MKKIASRPDGYVRAPDFAERIAGVQFPPEVWAVFAQCEEPRPIAEIARRAKLDEDVAAAALRRLVRRRLVQKSSAHKVQLDWQGYLNAQSGEAGSRAAVATAAPAAPALPASAAEAGPLAASRILAESGPAPASRTESVVAAESVSVEFVVDNVAAAATRRSAARDVLCFTVGKAPAPAGRPVLAA